MTQLGPARDSVPGGLLWLGVFGAPVLWSLQLLINYAAVAQGCSPAPAGHGALDPGTMRLTAVIVTLVAIVGTLGAGAVAWRTWHTASGVRAPARAEEQGSLIEIGEGRTRFIALFGMLMSGLFLIGVLFGGLSLLLVPGCG